MLGFVFAARSTSVPVVVREQGTDHLGEPDPVLFVDHHDVAFVEDDVGLFSGKDVAEIDLEDRFFTVLSTALDLNSLLRGPFVDRRRSERPSLSRTTKAPGELGSRLVPAQR